MATADPHSHADLAQGRTVRLELDLSVDFDARCLRGTARLLLEASGSGPLDLDTRDLRIQSVCDGTGRELPFTLGPRDPILGQRLRVERSEPTAEVVIAYTTGPDATGLMWLEPAMTRGGRHPFLLSQCQAIHARSLAPLQDTPRARIRYSARLTVPEGLGAVMSAAPGQVERGPRADTHAFEMPQPIPPYLLALAVGALDSRDLGPRTRVYAEPEVLDEAAWEFADVEQMLEAAEGLFGPYAWERFDFVVLPPAFPLGGMENPRMTFLTPTLLAGDRSLVAVLAHELAHSWTGNLVTNATNEDFWLNEGWTVYAERRIVEALYGPEAAAQASLLGRVALEAALEERSEAGQSTALCYPQAGLDPDAEFSTIPYEKGFLLVTALERAVGREAFDAFVQRYLERFRFTSIDTATFAAFALEELDLDLDLDAWLYAEGLPAGAPAFTSARLTELAALAQGWSEGARPDAGDWSTAERLFYLAALPPLDAAGCSELDALLGLSGSQNAELQCAWLTRAARAQMTAVEPELRAFLGRVGRTKLLKPVVAAMLEGQALAELARELVAARRSSLHSSTRLALDALLA